MRLTIRAVVLATMLAGCGGGDDDVDDAPQWAGRYFGTVRQPISCSAGASGTDTFDQDAPIVAAGKNVVTLDARSPCALTWDVTGTKATLRPRRCVLQGWTFRYTGGSATLSAPRISWEVSFTFEYMNDVSCAGTLHFDGQR